MPLSAPSWHAMRRDIRSRRSYRRSRTSKTKRLQGAPEDASPASRIPTETACVCPSVWIRRARRGLALAINLPYGVAFTVPPAGSSVYPDPATNREDYSSLVGTLTELQAFEVPQAFREAVDIARCLDGLNQFRPPPLLVLQVFRQRFGGHD